MDSILFSTNPVEETYPDIEKQLVKRENNTKRRLGLELYRSMTISN
jgi:hypothetical protein